MMPRIVSFGFLQSLPCLMINGLPATAETLRQNHLVPLLELAGLYCRLMMASMLGLALPFLSMSSKFV